MKVCQVVAGAFVMSGIALTSPADNAGITQRSADVATKLPVEGELRSFAGATAWLNSRALSAVELRGKVVLVDFWTYTCINWRRTLPYLRAWAERYKDHGLVVIGVHTPEFGFEKDIENVRRAAQEQGVGYPIALDSDYAIWRAFSNQYWPALYFIDAQGRIRHHQFGEGNYEQLERVIQQLLSEDGHAVADLPLASVHAHGAEVAADWGSLRSPESYLGYGRLESLASPVELARDRPRAYRTPSQLRLNEWALSGNWTLSEESAAVNSPGGTITYRFHARDVHLVMRPAANGHAVRFRVSIDGRPPGASHGVDIDADGRGTVDAPRMYQLIRQHGPIADRQFEIEFIDPGSQVFVFTFG
jgi:thiol-disulfide isomerase/thioredoxin